MLKSTPGAENWIGCFLGAVFVLVVGLAAGIAIAEWIHAMPAESPPPERADGHPAAGTPVGRVAEPAGWELFTFILRRNMTVFLVLLLGLVSAGLVTIVVLLGNGIAIGQLVGFARASGMSPEDVAYLLLPHGVLELGALCVAGAVGLRGIRLALGIWAVPTFKQMPRGSLRPSRLVHGHVGGAGPEGVSAHNDRRAPTRPWGALQSLRLGTVLAFGLGALAAAAGIEAFVTVEIAESLRGRW